MDVKEKLALSVCNATQKTNFKCEFNCEKKGKCAYCLVMADQMIANGVTVQECAYWQYIEDDVDEDNNIQAYCSVCHARDKHATSMIGKVPYCWKCGRKMMPKPPKGE